MDVIRFPLDENNYANTTKGKLVSSDDFESLQWTERFDDSGEFELTVMRGSKAHQVIRRGEMLTHTNTGVVMIVDSITSIKDYSYEPTEIVIKGHTLDHTLNRRPYGHRMIPGLTAVTGVGPGVPSLIAYDVKPDEHVISQKRYWILAQQILNELFDEISIHGLVTIRSDAKLGTPGPPSGALDIPYVIRLNDNSYNLVWDLLKNDEMSITSSRWREDVSADPMVHMSPNGQVNLMIYAPSDRSQTVSFFAMLDHVESLEVLDTDIDRPNGVLVVSKWFAIPGAVLSSAPGYLRQSYSIVVDESFDQEHDVEPVGLPKQVVISSMYLRSVAERKKALAKASMRSTKLDLTNPNTPKYRSDYHMGDFVSIHTEAGIEKVRVTEYTEILTKTSFEEYPTLSSI